jgi:hypothetical protein
MPGDFNGWVTLASTIVTAIAGGIVAWFTVVLAGVGKQQIADTKILQRAYLSVEPQGIEWSGEGVFVGQVIFKNVGKLPATDFVSVVKKIEVHDADWATPIPIDGDLPKITPGMIPIGAEVPQGSPGISYAEVAQANVSGGRYVYVYGRAKFKDGFGSERHVNFCHRYPWAKVQPLTSGYRISKEFARYHQYGNGAD